MSLFSSSKKSWISEHRWRESLPYFSHHYVEGTKRVRALGWLQLPAGIVIEYRFRRATKIIHLRVVAPGAQWRAVNIVRMRAAKWRRQLECPHCCTQTSTIYAIGPLRNQWRCDTCCPLPTIDHRPRRFRRHIREGNLLPLAAAIQSGTTAAIDARVAMELEGLAPSTLSARKHTRRACFRTASSRFKGWYSRNRLKTLRSIGRLIYVEGNLYVR